MSFLAADRREVESLMSKMTTCGDAIGRLKRDTRLLQILNPHWPGYLLDDLSVIMSRLTTVASQLEEQNEILARRINDLVPPAE